MKKKVKTKKPKAEKIIDFNAWINLNAEIQGMIPKLAEIYHEHERDMPSVEEEIREQINDLLDEVFNNYDSDKLENLLKKYKPKNN